MDVVCTCCPGWCQGGDGLTVEEVIPCGPPGRLTAGTYSHHPFGKEYDLNQNSMIMFQPLIFRGVCDVTWDGDLKKVKELSSLQLYRLYRLLGRLWIGSHDVWSISTKKIAFRCNDQHVDSLGSIRRRISKKILGTHLGWCRTLWEHVGTIPDRQVDLGIL